EKYFEVARELQDKGFAVLILDWPGQGLSQRLLDDPQKGHIDRFETFMGALANGLTAMSDLPEPRISLAHSMGGAIALAAIGQRLVDVKAAAFCAPMWGLPLGRVQRYFIWAMRVMGRSNDFAMKPGPPERFEENIVTYDERRWQLNRDLTDAAPELALGPVTWGWLGASLDIFEQISDDNILRSVDIPIFVASADEEKLVDNRAHARVAAALPDCEHITVDGAMHEILMERDDKRAEFWAGFERMLTRAGL
ncbi:MAG: alpha/beta fold hydrolase, partial [Pseudomonadota bacterium]